MQLYSEIPDHRDSNGNKNRSIYMHATSAAVPAITRESMFLFLFTDTELRTNCHILAEKMRDFGDATSTLFNPILDKRAPEGWSKQEVVLPTVQAVHGIYIFRSNQHQEQVIVLAEDHPEILRGTEFFTQGYTVSTMLQRLQQAVFLYARKVVNTLVHAEVNSLDESRLLKRASERFRRNWELSRSYFDVSEQWSEVDNLARIAVEHAESECAFFPSPSPAAPASVTITAQRDVNLAGGDINHGGAEEPATFKKEIIAIGLMLAIGIPFLIVFTLLWHNYGYQITTYLMPKIPDSAFDEWRKATAK